MGEIKQTLPMCRADYLLSHLAQECAEVIVRIDCSCHVRGDMEIIYCPLHGAATGLLEALKRIARHAEKRRSGGIYPKLADVVDLELREQEARMVIRKAEGN